MDRIRSLAGAQTADRGHSALIVLHPTGTDDAAECRRAGLVLAAVRRIGFDGIDIVAPNNDPGSAGITRRWSGGVGGARVWANVDRPRFLAMIRDSAILIGNSSSGIIEAASFGTPVVDVGDRQAGRERSGNVVHVGFDSAAIGAAIHSVWRDGRPRRWRGINVYGGDDVGKKIAAHLADLRIDDSLRRKLIAY